MNNNYYNPDNGITVMGRYGSERFTELLDSYSQVYTSINTTSPNKFCVDSAWESQNIYYIKYGTSFGTVYKMSFDGTTLYSLNLSNPIMLSVIQNNMIMARTVQYPPQNEQGCWIADNASSTVIKTDNTLTIVVEVPTFNNPSCIVSDVDGGCYVADDTLQTISKISSSGDILATFSYAAISASTIREMKTYKEGGKNRLWVMVNDDIYGLQYLNGAITKWLGGALSPIYDTPTESSSSYSSSEYSSASSVGEEYHIGGMDLNRNNNYLYVTVGNATLSWIICYDGDGNVLTKSHIMNITYPYIIRVSQSYGSSAIYLLSDSSKGDEYGYGSSSSSSSSSYIENWSSSSSSYIEGWSSSSLS